MALRPDDLVRPADPCPWTDHYEATDLEVGCNLPAGHPGHHDDRPLRELRVRQSIERQRWQRYLDALNETPWVEHGGRL